MKKVCHISYWIVAIILVAGVLTSLGYRFSEALFIGTTFLPGALAVRYFYPKTKADDRKTTIKNIIFLTLGLVISQIFIILLAHVFINSLRENINNFYECPALPEILMNPIFIAIMTVIITLGHHFIRIHRSYLVNKSAITNIDTDTVYINETELPISRKYKKSIQNS